MILTGLITVLQVLLQPVQVRQFGFVLANVRQCPFWSGLLGTPCGGPDVSWEQSLSIAVVIVVLLILMTQAVLTARLGTQVDLLLEDPFAMFQVDRGNACIEPDRCRGRRMQPTSCCSWR